ncbi:MAG: Ni/Fe-hydrogenase subunit HybB-like protein [Natronomonas sp.]|jgi:Ni/Fe-hydrogenase subunit HybB-like protein|uniref:hypothetical protein n=1 Tax=Natronomonas sp. TaxID=2184060 RepID=UPI003989EDB7
MNDGPEGESKPTAPSPDSAVDVETVVTYLKWGAVLGLSLLAAIAVVGLYTSLSSIIDIWVARRFQPFARAALNFGVLCAAVAGVFAVLRRL